MKNIIKSTLILVCITLVAGLALAGVYEITKDPIAEAERLAKENAYRAVMPDAASFEAVVETSYPMTTDSGMTVSECLVAKNADGADIGHVVNVTSPNGYGGSITIAVGILADGSIKGISVIAQSETAGLGAVCAEDKFTGQFSGIRGFVEYVKNGKTEPNQIDAISGATITTKAVTEAVNVAVGHVDSLKGGNE